MTLWRSVVLVLVALAVAGVGWIGWEQHHQTEEQVKQTCIARAHANIDINASLTALSGTLDKSGATLIAQGLLRLNKCG